MSLCYFHAERLQLPKQLYKARGYDHRDALFGLYPHGQTLQELPLYYYYLPPSINNTSPLCHGPESVLNVSLPVQPPNHLHHNHFHLHHHKGDPRHSWMSLGPFALLMDKAPEDECSVAHQVHMAQYSLGASVVLIADNRCVCGHAAGSTVCHKNQECTHEL